MRFTHSGTIRLAPKVGLLVLLTLAISNTGCDSGGDTGANKEVLFRMTPDGGGAVFEIRPLASWHEPTDPPCQLQIYEIAGANRYFQFATLNEPTCAGVFEATIEDGAGVEYFLSGSVLRVFGVGSGPFATGTWSASNGAITGSFQFFEGEFLNAS